MVRIEEHNLAMCALYDAIQTLKDSKKYITRAISLLEHTAQKKEAQEDDSAKQIKKLIAELGKIEDECNSITGQINEINQQLTFT